MLIPFKYLYTVCASLSYICTFYAQNFNISCTQNICIYDIYIYVLYVHSFLISMHRMRMPVMHTYEHTFRVQCRHNMSEQFNAMYLVHRILLYYLSQLMITAQRHT